MDLGIITIRNDGKIDDPSWSIESINQGFLFDTVSLDDAYRKLVEHCEGELRIDQVILELE